MIGRSLVTELPKLQSEQLARLYCSVTPLNGHGASEKDRLEFLLIDHSEKRFEFAIFVFKAMIIG